MKVHGSEGGGAGGGRGGGAVDEVMMEENS